MIAASCSLRLSSVVALALIASACSGKSPQPDGGTTNPPLTTSCIETSDCPDPNLFFCNSTTSKCEPSCRTKDQCTAAVRGQFAIDFCDNGLGCQCDEGKCVGSLCSSDADCGAQVCRNGRCSEAPAASTVASCQITPDLLVMRSGSKATFSVSAWDAQQKPVVVKSGITWSAAAGGLVTGSGTEATAQFTAGAVTTATGPSDAVQAAVGTANCKAKVLVLPATVPANKLDVEVTDELSGRPIDGATVMASGPTGAMVGTLVTTDAHGFAELDVTGSATVSVTVFHTQFNYLTVANYDLTAQSPDARFLAMVLRRNQVDNYGGYKGAFTNVPATSNVHAGIAGMSLAGSITDLSVAQLLGPNVKTHVKIGNAIDRDNVPLPAGTFLGFGETQIKNSVSAQGLAGVCSHLAGVSDYEAAIKAGTCGTRTAWALAGDVALGDLPIDAVANGLDGVDFGKVLGKIIPIFKKFNSSVQRDVEFSLKPTPIVDGLKNFDDTSNFTPMDHDFTQVPLAFNFVARSPELPKMNGIYVDGVVLIGGAIVPGRGMVPLGLGAAVNTTPLNGKTDIQSELPAEGLITVRMAPTHHGLEGSAYGLISLALPLKSATDASAGIASSALFTRVPKGRLGFDPSGTAPVDLAGPYLGFPEGARYNYTDMAQSVVPGRNFRFAATTGLATSTLIRVVFTDYAEHQWVVYLDPAQALTGVVLPKPPGLFADRTFASGGFALNDSRSTLLVQSLRLNDAPGSTTGAPITFNQLVNFNSTNADRMADFTTAFSFIGYGRPEIAWLKPAATGEAVPKDTSVKVQVAHFKIGTGTDEGSVVVSFTGGSAACQDTPPVNTDASQGKGEISIPLPTGCVGTNVVMTATLYDNATSAPIKPVVASQISVNIN